MADVTQLALARASGLELGSYRPRHVDVRIRRALGREDVPSVERLVRLLGADAEARARFRRSIAISVSGLFRDPEQFKLLERQILPALLSGRKLSACSVGCADGSELYSLALIVERLGALDRAFLLGCDLLEENLEKARAGLYDGVEIPEHVRARIRWEQRDVLLEGAPAGKWRLILCRNVAIYFTPEAKTALHRSLASSLALGGVLLLGRSERLVDPRGLGLEPFAAHAYRKTR